MVACGDDDAADPERFCELLSEEEPLNESILASAPDEARELVGEGRNLLDEAVAVAPDEIRTSFEVVADSYTQILDLIEEADFDVLQVDPAENTAALETAASAIDAVEEWVDDNCSSE